MAKKIDENLFDIRVVQRHIADGRITRKDYDQWLASLTDEAEEGEDTETRMAAPPVPNAPA